MVKLVALLLNCGLTEGKTLNSKLTKCFLKNLWHTHTLFFCHQLIQKL